MSATDDGISIEHSRSTTSEEFVIEPSAPRSPQVGWSSWLSRTRTKLVATGPHALHPTIVEHSTEAIAHEPFCPSLTALVRVEPKFAVARTFRTFASPFGRLVSAHQRETLRTDGATYKQELSEEDSYVKIGDPVVESVGDEFADTKD